MQLRRSPFSCLCLPLFCLCSCSCFCCCCCCCFGLIREEKQKEQGRAAVDDRWCSGGCAGRSRNEPGKGKKIAGEEEGKSPGKEEEKGGSRAPHVASPLVGKISTLTPEVFMTSNFLFTKIFQLQINPHTPIIKYLQYKLFTKYFTQN